MLSNVSPVSVPSETPIQDNPCYFMEFGGKKGTSQLLSAYFLLCTKCMFQSLRRILQWTCCYAHYTEVKQALSI